MTKPAWPAICACTRARCTYGYYNILSSWRLLAAPINVSIKVFATLKTLQLWHPLALRLRTTLRAVIKNDTDGPSRSLLALTHVCSPHTPNTARRPTHESRLLPVSSTSPLHLLFSCGQHRAPSRHYQDIAAARTSTCISTCGSGPIATSRPTRPCHCVGTIPSITGRRSRDVGRFATVDPASNSSTL